MVKFCVLSIVLLACFCTIACSPITRVNGFCFDENNAPLENVKITLTGKSFASRGITEFITKADGKYDFGEISVSGELPTEIILTATKDGFATFSKELKFGEDNVDKITMKRK
ncbi:MAG: carboxypeptidase regulatory-like domain-containing protein [Pyrinomonadaceae bacterium]|nr:carboxypeptidase regulatory-like domain-containing protein [Pyrinomonadaceae bacterium]